MFVCIGVVFACFAMPLIPTNAEDSFVPTDQPDLVGTFIVFTTTPNVPMVKLVDPKIISIAGEAFLKGDLTVDSGGTVYVAVRHICTLSAIKETPKRDPVGE